MKHAETEKKKKERREVSAKTAKGYPPPPLPFSPALDLQCRNHYTCKTARAVPIRARKKVTREDEREREGENSRSSRAFPRS